MVLPGMKARRRGNIVNIGSATASAMSEAPLLSGAHCRTLHPQRRSTWWGLMCGASPPSATPHMLTLLLNHCRCLPSSAVYAASKAYLESLSRSVDAEAAPLGVRCQCLWPMFVATRMPGISTASLMAPSPDAWAAAAMRQLNHEASFTPFWFHGLVVSCKGAAGGSTMAEDEQ